VAFGLLGRAVAAGSFTKETEGGRLAAALTVFASQRQRLPGKFESVRVAVRKHAYFAHRRQEQSLGKSMSHILENVQRLFHQRQAFSSSAQPRIRIAQTA